MLKHSTRFIYATNNIMGVGTFQAREQFPPVNAQCVCVCVRTTDPVVQRRLVHLDGRCGSGPENGPSWRRMPPWIPFFECLFSEIANEFFTKIIEKAADKKKNKQTNREDPAHPKLGPDRVLDSQMSDTSRKTSQKVSRKRAADLS